MYNDTAWPDQGPDPSGIGSFQAVSLAGSAALTCGCNRVLYDHPLLPGVLIKLPLLDRSQRSSTRLHYWRDCLREQIEYIRLANHHGELPRFVPHFFGYVKTDLGVGMCYEKLVDDCGGLAPTLRQLLDAGAFDDARLAQLRQLYAELLASPIVVGDLNSHNVAFCYIREHGHHFKVVDGLGDKRLLPLLRLFPAMNRWRKRRRIQRSLRRAGCPLWRSFGR